jgi:protein-S-isoprenylcysteine O-methyltransferase Ste14
VQLRAEPDSTVSHTAAPTAGPHRLDIAGRNDPGDNYMEIIMQAIQTQPSPSAPAASIVTTAERPQRATGLGVVYAIASYAVGMASLGYFGAFVHNVLVPKGVDDGTPRGLAAALAIDIGLMILWGLQHSVMARQSFKDLWTKVIPAHTERATYVLATGIALGAVMWGWSPIAGVVWHVQAEAARVTIWAVCGAGWLLLLLASFEIDHFELFGLKQPVQALRGVRTEAPDFERRYIYRVVRHPIQTGVLAAMWASPDMSVGHLVFALLMTVYVFIGLYFEERALVRRFGDTYRQYRREVAMLVPFTRYL